MMDNAESIEKAPEGLSPPGFLLLVDLADEVTEIVRTTAAEDAGKHYTDPRPREGNAHDLEEVSTCRKAK